MKKNSSDKRDSIFESLKLMKKCPLCEHDYEENKIVLLDEYKNNHLVHVTCPECNNAILHMALSSSLGMNAIGIITDLSAMEVARFKMRPEINEDNLLDFHKFIKESDKKFIKFFLKYNK
jgi:hypothetical protein